MKRKKKVVIVATHPIQYQAPLFRELSSEMDLTVVYMAKMTSCGQAAAGFGVPFDWDVPVLQGYKYIFAQNISPVAQGQGRFRIILKGVKDTFRRIGPDLIICFGWFPFGYMQVINYAKKNGINLFLRGESNLLMRRTGFQSRVREFFLKHYFKNVDRFLTIGKLNRIFYRSMGVEEEKMVFAPYSIDTEYFRNEFEKCRAGEHGDGKVVFGFSGKFIDKKRPYDILRAAAMCENKNSIKIVMIGDGPLRSVLEQMSCELKLDVDFRGFLNQSEIVKKGYFDIDCLILPSDTNETWGLVVNEAMTGGIPAIVSDLVGSWPDLITNGETGYVFRNRDISDLARKIDDFISLKNKGISFRENVLRRIEKYSLDKTAEGIQEAIKSLER